MIAHPNLLNPSLSPDQAIFLELALDSHSEPSQPATPQALFFLCNTEDQSPGLHTG